MNTCSPRGLLLGLVLLLMAVGSTILVFSLRDTGDAEPQQPPATTSP